MEKSTKRAICKSIGEDFDRLTEDLNDQTVWSFGSHEYLVLTDEQADTAAAESIEQDLWSFRPSFLAGETGLDERVFARLSPLFEDAQPAVLALVKATCGLERLVEHVIGADGRGYILSSRDGVELDVDTKEGTFYVFRRN